MNRLLRVILGVGLALAMGLAALILVYRFVAPVSTLMLARWVQGESVERRYVPLERISPDLRTAVIVSEDARFCRHAGVDWGALREVIDAADDDGPSRGASTITMQSAKNLFLWPSKSFIRKGIEIPVALLIELEWPKRRILEVYLNIAEWGDGVFGVEAAAQRYFHKSAERLDAKEAALLATALPNPRRRNAGRPSRVHAALAQRIAARARTAAPFVECAR
ncbi:monofunctional biosynthetic peptidoglycan transglycosylase [Methylocapsa aurea]|uniref:monofunctional biosynthetic peptidoglycan transglycosylase n=1 Tax=Methylocapsa aurea TaxID=663610 RepID=UPI000B2C9176|nr:monofunctional biosynthetic peptidoglycan transglycosylase [Methylocapsa aurea]